MTLARFARLGRVGDLGGSDTELISAVTVNS